MQVVGIIVEYNPFHNGHLWHVTEARQKSGAKYVIGVMSGNFVQRGEPAIFDKWARATMAVREGVDLVLELPAVFSVRSAQYFATGGIRLISRLGIVSHVCFGAETIDLASLQAAAQALADTSTLNIMRQHLKTGQTYAASLAAALVANSGIDMSVLTSPNNVLAIEYLRAITAYAPQLVPLPIKRHFANYHDTAITSAIASATAVRKTMLDNGLLLPGSLAYSAVPSSCAHHINDLIHAGRGPVTLDSFDNLLLHKLRTSRLGELAALPDVGEGLHNKISDAALRATTARELLLLIKSKRYTLTRLQRIMIHALLGTTKNQLAEFDQAGPLYARVLAFNQNGRLLLKHIGEHAQIPVVTKTSHFLTSKQREQDNLQPLAAMLSIDTKASDIYTLGFPNRHWRAGGQDFQTSPVYIAD